MNYLVHPQVRRETAEQKRTTTVLVVDDDKSIGELVSAILTPLGYTVIEAADTDDAFRLAQQTAGRGFNLLIADVAMPKMDGRDLGKWLKLAYFKMKILFISGVVRDSLAEATIFDKSAAFLAKPFSPGELVANVEALLALE